MTTFSLHGSGSLLISTDRILIPWRTWNCSDSCSNGKVIAVQSAPAQLVSELVSRVLTYLAHSILKKFKKLNSHTFKEFCVEFFETLALTNKTYHKQAASYSEDSLLVHK